MAKPIYKSIILSLILLLFRHNAIAQNWQSVGGGFNYSVCAFYTDTLTDRLYIGGQFVEANGIPITGICYWDGVTYNAMGCGVDWDCVTPLLDNNFTYPVFNILKYNGDIYISGGFSLADTKPIVALAKWNGSTWDSVGACPNSVVYDMCITGSNELVVSGAFDSIGGIKSNGVAKWNGTNWYSIGGGLPISPGNYAVNSVIEFQGETYIAGNFSDNTAQLNEIAKWNGSAWINPGIRFYGGLAHINDMIVYNNELYVGGMFLAADGNLSDYIVKYDGITWTDVGGGMQGTNGQIRQFCIHNNELYAVGVFEGAGGVPAEYIAKWDEMDWCGLGTDFNNINIAVGSFRNELYIGCSKTIGTDTVNYIAKWNGGNYTDTCGHIVAGVDEHTHNAANLIIYPNPSSNQITIEFNSDKTHSSSLAITSILGQTVKTIPTDFSPGKNKIEIDISQLSKGLYFVQLQNSSELFSGKFIKE